MRRSMVIASAVVCALGTADLASAQSVGFDRFGFEIRLGGGAGGGSFHTARELERAEARLHGARRAHQEAVWKLDAVAARQSALARELDSAELRIADYRGAEHALRRLHEQFEAAGRDAARIEADLARLRGLAAEAEGAADAAREAHFRRAESSSLILEARGRIDTAQQELNSARQWVLEQQLYPSFEWQRAVAWRDDLARRLADAERDRVPTYELDRLRNDLAEAEGRLEAIAGDAISREPTIRAAGSRLGDAQRRLDAAWAGVERDLEHDRDFRRAREDASRFAADAARADNALCKVRDHIARLQGDIDRTRQTLYAVDIRDLERRAGAIRHDLDFVSRDVHAARQCLAQAECELRDAQFAYDAAYATHQRCLADERHSISLRIEHRDGPKHDRGRGDDDDDDDHDDRDDRRGGYNRRDDDRGGNHHRDGEDRRDDGRRGGDDDRRGDDDGDDREGRSGGEDRTASRDDRGRQSGGDDRRASAASGGASTGTYRDRGERYERARSEDTSNRQRTRG